MTCAGCVAGYGTVLATMVMPLLFTHGNRNERLISRTGIRISKSDRGGQIKYSSRRSTSDCGRLIGYSSRRSRSWRMDAFPPEQQLVSEWYTPSLPTTLTFLQAFGFVVLREEEAHFAELAWGSKSRLMVEQIDGFLTQDDGDANFGFRGYVGNIRVLVDDVDALYGVALRTQGATILKELGDRYYGLRDFTVGGPFGLALRFASPLPGFSDN